MQSATEISYFFSPRGGKGQLQEVYCKINVALRFLKVSVNRLPEPLELNNYPHRQPSTRTTANTGAQYKAIGSYNDSALWTH